MSLVEKLLYLPGGKGKLLSQQKQSNRKQQAASDRKVAIPRVFSFLSDRLMEIPRISLDSEQRAESAT
jgi:hypothetical protein